jgi:iron(III) transport system ATP-binding protein
MSLVQIREVTRRYGGTLALDRFSLDIAEGGRTAVVGPSGSGKTTLLRLIAGFDAPDSGQIVFDGAVIADGRAVVPAHRRRIGFVAQDGALFPHLTAGENIGFGLPRGIPHREARVAALAEAVELDRGMMGRHPHELSGGQQQRVALARALATKPRLMLLDEPFSALDAGLRENTRFAVARILAASGTTAVLVTHDQAEALSFADHIAVLDRGRLMQAGTPREVYFRPRDAGTARFLGDAIILPASLANGLAECALGRIAVDTSVEKKQALVMVRPEQLRLAISEGASGAGPRGVVCEVAFSGPTSRIVVAMDSEPAGGLDGPLVLSMPSSGAPAAGTTVTITVAGTAHALGEP